MHEIKFNRKLCKECGICVEVCPKKLISMEKNRIISDLCTGCKLCEYYCPDFAIEVL